MTEIYQAQYLQTTETHLINFRETNIYVVVNRLDIVNIQLTGLITISPTQYDCQHRVPKYITRTDCAT